MWYTYIYHIVGYLGNCKALHEITDLVHEMLSVCAPLGLVRLRLVRLGLVPLGLVNFYD